MKTPFPFLLAVLSACVLAGCSKSTDDPISPEPPVPQGPSGSIVYFNNDRDATYSHLTTLKFDGTESRILLRDTLTDGYLPYNQMASWSFDRSRIVFVSDRASGTIFPDLFIIGSDGSGLKQITRTPDRGEYFPSLSPDGKTVLFSAQDSNNRMQLFLCALDGSNERQLTNFTNPSRSVTARHCLWSYDGTTVYFNSNMDGTAYNIYSIKADGTGLRRITTSTTTSDWLNSVSRNGVLAYYCSGTPYVFTIHADGTGKKQVTDFWSGDPALSPDGSIIAFISNKDKASPNEGEDIYTVNADGTGLKRLTNTPGNKYYLDWK